MVKRQLVQVEKVVENITYYCWKLKGVIDPLETEMVWLVSGVTPDTALYERYYINLSLLGTKFGTNYGKWGVCYICQSEFPINKMTSYNGHWYCQKDYKDDFSGNN
jgi:hypothetical protein